MADQLDRFTPMARRAFAVAQAEAVRLNHDYIGCDHLLIGVAQEGGEVARWLRRRLSVELAKVRAALGEARASRSGDSAPTLDAGAQHAIRRAIDAAHGMKADSIGVDHLLLGLVDRDGAATTLLANLGIAPDEIRRAIDELHRSRAMQQVEQVIEVQGMVSKLSAEEAADLVEMSLTMGRSLDAMIVEAVRQYWLVVSKLTDDES